MEKKERQFGLDLIRVFAILFVFFTHGIQYKELLYQSVETTEWSYILVLRFLALSCVPLFVILTGFLNETSEANSKHYKKIIPLIISYVFISLLELIGTTIFVYADGKTQYIPDNLKLINWPIEIIRMFNFTENSYAWYFEMYIGLFLLIPFLNILWNNVKTKKEKIILIVSLVFLTMIPRTLEGIRFDWIEGKNLEGWLDVAPDYWKIMYPLALFFIGKYIRDYRPNFNIILKLLLIVVSLAIPVLCCYFVSQKQGTYAWYVCNGFGTITNAFVATSVFLAFYTIKLNIPIIPKIFSQVAICSFDMYLFSSIFDKILYYNFKELSYFATAGIVFACTFISARIWIWIRDLLFKKLIKLY